MQSNKILEVIKLGVLLAVIIVAAVAIPTSWSHVDSAVNGVARVQYSGVSGALTTIPSGDGMSVGAPVGSGFSTFLFIVKLFAYAIIWTIVGCALCLFFSALGILTSIVEKIGTVIGKMVGAAKRTIAPTSAASLVVGKTKDGKAVELGTVLTEYRTALSSGRSGLQSANERLAKLEALTAQLPPPKPPKTPEETIAELMAEINRLKGDREATPVVVNEPKATQIPAAVEEPKPATV